MTPRNRTQATLGDETSAYPGPAGPYIRTLTSAQPEFQKTAGIQHGSAPGRYGRTSRKVMPAARCLDVAC
jgi:hypothetical protein